MVRLCFVRSLYRHQDFCVKGWFCFRAVDIKRGVEMTALPTARPGVHCRARARGAAAAAGRRTRLLLRGRGGLQRGRAPRSQSLFLSVSLFLSISVSVSLYLPLSAIVCVCVSLCPSLPPPVSPRARRGRWPSSSSGPASS